MFTSSFLLFDFSEGFSLKEICSPPEPDGETTTFRNALIDIRGIRADEWEESEAIKFDGSW